MILEKFAYFEGSWFQEHQMKKKKRKNGYARLYYFVIMKIFLRRLQVTRKTERLSKH